MNKELKTKWIEALRGGKFKQCRGTYFRDNQHCCLNVLHIVADLGLRDRAERAVGESSVLSKLVSMNDGTGEYDGRPQSFEQIADWVEANVPDDPIPEPQEGSPK